MQLTEQEVIAGLSHEKIYVRDTLLDYFENRHSLPLELTHAAIEVVERFGWDDAFLFPHKIRECPHDEKTLTWCLDEIDKLIAGTTTLKAARSTLPMHLVSWVSNAPVELLQKYRERIASYEAFSKSLFYAPGSMLDKIDRRIEIAALDAQQAWDRLIEHCNSVADVKTFKEANISDAELLLEPIAEAGDNSSLLRTTKKLPLEKSSAATPPVPAEAARSIKNAASELTISRAANGKSPSKVVVWSPILKES